VFFGDADYDGFVENLSTNSNANKRLHDPRLRSEGIEAQNVWGASTKVITNGSNIQVTSMSGFRSSENTFFKNMPRTPPTRLKFRRRFSEQEQNFVTWFRRSQ